jgi:Rrf2 family protein
MRLSTKGRYGVRAMVDLGLHVGEGPVPREEIAARQEISANYLARLFAKLVRAGLISSVKGPGGGYVLARGTAAITAGDIIQAVEEPLAPVYCVNGESKRTCHRLDGCVTHFLWERLGERIAELLDSVTLEELCVQAQQLQSQMSLGDQRGDT